MHCNPCSRNWKYAFLFNSECGLNWSLYITFSLIPIGIKKQSHQILKMKYSEMHFILGESIIVI